MPARDETGDRISRRELEHLFGLVTTAADAIISVDADFRIVLFNDGAVELFGYTREEAIGLDVDTLIPVSRRAHHKEHIRTFASSSVNARRMGQRQEISALRKNGTEFPAEASILRFVVDGTVNFSVILRDVSERKKALDVLATGHALLEARVEERTRELKEATERFQLLFNNAPIAMIMVDGRGRIHHVNDAATRLFQYSHDELVGSSVDTLVPNSVRHIHAQHRDGYLRVPSFRPMGAGRELFAERKDGTKVPVEIGLNPISVGNETYIVSTIIDISERKSAEDRTRVMLRELTHRSKNLLSVIQAIADETAAFSPDLDAFSRDFSSRIQAIARAHDLLVASNWEGVRMDDLLTGQLDFLGPDILGRITASGGPLRLNAMAAQYLALAVHELATNALKHGALSQRQGRVQVEWRLVAEAEPAPRVRLIWREGGGPRPREARRSGFGDVLLGQVVPAMLNGVAASEFAPEGLTWTIEAPIARLESLAGERPSL